MGRRVLLRPLTGHDFGPWRDVRRASADWLTPWEPAVPPDAPDVVEDPYAFSAMCAARAEEARLGAAYGFGLFAEGRLAGEVNITQVYRGVLQNCSLGYWVAHDLAGNGYVPEGVVLALRFVFEDLALHRAELGVVPENHRSLRVPAKLGIRREGLGERMVEINGRWQDHVRFAITAEEWVVRRDELLAAWIY